MTASARRRSGWVSLCLTLVARMLLGVLGSLLLWSLAPVVTGMHPTVVMTGSMLPRLVPGDVVFSRTVPARDLQLGQTLLYPDPDRPGHLRMHRWVAVAADGRLITKGDANPQNDSTPVDRSAVVGVASLRIPFVARPVVWANDGRTDLLALTVVGLLVTVVAACWFRAADDEAADDGADVDETGADDDRSGDPAGIDPARSPWSRRLVQSGAALLVTVGLGATFATGADAAGFARPTSNPTDTWAAATYFSCAGAARGAGARFAWPLSESSGSTAQDVTANDLDGTYSGGVTYGTSGPCGGATGVTLNGTSGVVRSSSTTNSEPALTLQVWFRTASTRGGTLMSLTATTGFIITTDTTSMAIGMTTAGTLSFGVTASGTKRVTSPAAYRDNVWHLATGVVGAAGMVLYVDGVAVASTAAATSASSVDGTPRVGYGDSSDLGTGTYDYFQGSVAYASLYRAALPAATVLAQYATAVS